MRGMFNDFCETCMKPLPADKLSGFGIQCEDCDPEGIEREGTYYDECCAEEEAVV